MPLLPQTCKLLYKQAELLAQGSKDAEGLSLASKTFEWEGLHDVERDLAKLLDHRMHRTLKFIRDYGGDMEAVAPATRAGATPWDGYPDAYDRILALLLAEQQGWKEIAAATCTSDADASEFASKRLLKNIHVLEVATRWTRKMEQFGDNVAAWQSFDKMVKLP